MTITISYILNLTKKEFLKDIQNIIFKIRNHFNIPNLPLDVDLGLLLSLYNQMKDNSL